MKMPNFASSYQSGTRWALSDSSVGAKAMFPPGPRRIGLPMLHSCRCGRQERLLPQCFWRDSRAGMAGPASTNAFSKSPRRKVAGVEMPWNYGDILDAVAEAVRPDAPAFVHGEKRITWAD